MSGKTVYWQAESAPEELYSILETLGEEYPVAKGCGEGISVRFEKKSGGGLSVKLSGGKAIVEYEKVSGAARGIGALLAGIPEDGGELKENIPFSTFGIMLDCSRNAVMTVEHFKKWLRRLALFGYNMAMLYTEDTYELPEEDYFGYMRGRYTAEELKEIDVFAAKLNIEMIGCVQTLGHLAQILKWQAYSDVKDTNEVMLTSEEKTYELIDKMLDLFQATFKSRRIHVGMDETHDLGRGRFMDINGYKRGFDIFNEHLDKVAKRCKERGLSPMIWSDMYFRMGSKTQDYYDKDCVIPDDVKAKIPQEAQLVYWDYYHKEEDFYTEWIKRHRELGFNPLMGSGVWTWKRLWHHHKQTKETIDPCIDACLKAKLDEFFFTMWGDDGAYCEFDSALAGLCYAAERCYSGGEPDENMLEKRFDAACSGSYEAHKTASEMENEATAAAILWDDPLLGIYWNNQARKEDGYWQKILEQYSGIETRLAGCERGKAGDIVHALAIVKTLKAKIGLRLKLEAAWQSKSNDALKDVASMIPAMKKEIEELSETFRAQWFRKNKPFGFEVIQVRLAGLAARYAELGRRIQDILSGASDSIPELDEKASGLEGVSDNYSRLATGSSIF